MDRRGCEPAGPLPSDPAARSQPDQESSFARQHGVSWVDLDLTREYHTIPAPARVAAYLGIPADSQVCERRWVHAVDGVVMRVAWSYVPMSRFANTVLTDISEPPWPGGTIAQLLSLGYDITSVHQDITARLATPAEAAALGLDEGNVVMEVWRVQLAKQQPIEVAQHIHPARGGTVLSLDIPIPPVRNPYEGYPPDGKPL